VVRDQLSLVRGNIVDGVLLLEAVVCEFESEWAGFSGVGLLSGERKTTHLYIVNK